MVFFMFTDVQKQATDLMFCGKDAAEIVGEAFHTEVADGKAVLPGVVSRKKAADPAADGRPAGAGGGGVSAPCLFCFRMVSL